MSPPQLYPQADDTPTMTLTPTSPTSSSTVSKSYTLTPAQLALQAERKAAKLAKKAEAQAKNGVDVRGSSGLAANVDGKGKVLERRWKEIKSEDLNRVGEKVKIVTWNMLAQTLVRRELFPGSDCLRWGDRKPMLLAELAMYSTADVICLQECDRLRELLPAIPAHIPIQARGPGKLHGLVILYRPDRFTVLASREIQLDLEFLSAPYEQDHAEGRRRARGGSRVTKNMGLIVALQDKAGKGLVVVTAHLFWHPKFEYERVRQIIVLLRAVRRLQEEQDCTSWPVVFAGDLNTQPCEAAYQLLAAPHEPLHLDYIQGVEASRLVHTSIDNFAQAELVSLATSTVTPGESVTSSAAAQVSRPVVVVAGEEKEEKDEKGEEELPDSNERSIANTRDHSQVDGILTIDELIAAAREVMKGVPRVSAYASVEWATPEVGGENAEKEGDKSGMTFGSRSGGMVGAGAGEGSGEPVFTCFTPLFKLTLDYLFLFGPGKVTAVLEPPKVAQLGDGLPRKGISASDHLAVGCEVQME